MANLRDLINDANNHLIDVRTPEEVAEISVPGAINIPLDSITLRVGDFKDMAELGEVVLFCRSGVRSGQAMEFLKQQGISRVHNAGGYADVLSQIN